VGIRVLIAEDEANIVESLSFILGRAGHEVCSVGDGEAALLRLRAAPAPQLLILDVMLPRRNGFEVLKAIRADARLASCPVVMLSAKTQAHDRALALELGAVAYVAKPFSNRELVDLVAELGTPPTT
jgi:DNA-binding response OmpR family regulator